MTNFENKLLNIRDSPNTTKSFEDVSSIGLELFNLSSNSNAEDYESPKSTVSLVSDLTIENKMKQIVSKPDNKNNKYLIGEQRSIFMNISSQESLCSECKFCNRFKSFIDSPNNMQRQTQTENETTNEVGCSQCFHSSYKMNQINDMSEEKLLSKNRLTSTQYGMKRCRSESNASTTNRIQISSHKRFKSNMEVGLSVPNLADDFDTARTFDAKVEYRRGFIKDNVINNNDASMQVAELRMKKFFELSDGEEDLTEKLGQMETIEKSPAEETDRSSLNQTIVAENQEKQELDLKFGNSTFSASTIEELHLIDCSNDIQSIKELRESDIAKCNTSTISASTVQKVYQTNAPDGTDLCKVSQNGSEIESEKKSLVKSTIIDDKIIQEDEISAAEIEQDYLKNSNHIKDSDNNSTTIIRKAHDIAIQVGIPDESLLEISMESEINYMGRSETINRRKIESIHVIRNPNENFLNIERKNEDNKNIEIGLIDVNTVNTNTSVMESSSTLKNIKAGDSVIVNLPENVGTKLVSDTGLEKIEMIENPNTVDAKTFDDNMQSSGDYVSLDFLPESELRRIEKEAYEKTTNTDDPIPKNINTNQEDVFFKPEQSNLIAETNADDLILPDWVTNPVLEPNYEKMRRAIEMRRQFIRKLLQEILRLSTIVSKVSDVLRAGNQNSDLAELQKSNTQIEESPSIQSLDNNLNNRCSNSRTFTQKPLGINPHQYSHVENRGAETNDIFYVPTHSSRPAYNTGLINTNNLREELEKRDKFYVPDSNILKFNNSPFFNPRSYAKSNQADFSKSYVESNASKLFYTLKRNSDVNIKYGSNISSNLYNGQDRKISSIVETFPLGKNNITMNRDYVNSGTNDSIFYLPDKSSLVSNNNAGSSCIKNNQNLYSKNIAKRVSTDFKLDKSRLQFYGESSASRTHDNYDSIFYNGNKVNGTNFKKL